MGEELKRTYTIRIPEQVAARMEDVGADPRDHPDHAPPVPHHA